MNGQRFYCKKDATFRRRELTRELLGAVVRIRKGQHDIEGTLVAIGSVFSTVLIQSKLTQAAGRVVVPNFKLRFKENNDDIIPAGDTDKR